MKVKVKRKTKLMIIKKVVNKNFCFFIISGKQKFLSEFFGKNSVLHNSFFKHLINIDFLVRYAFSYVCIFKLKDFIKLFELVYDRRFVVHQICVNNSFINFYYFKNIKNDVKRVINKMLFIKRRQRNSLRKIAKSDFKFSCSVPSLVTISTYHLS